MIRREFITLIGGAAAAWPLAARAQQPAMPVIGYLGGGSLGTDAHLVDAFRQGLGEAGYVEGRNVAIEYRWAENQFDRLPAMAADLVSRRVAAIVSAGGGAAASAAKAATTTIPVVFHVGVNPVEAGLVASLNRPGGNLTGVTGIGVELDSKRLQLLHELVPTATVIALLLSPTSPAAEIQSRDLQTAARGLGLTTNMLHATSERDFDAVFASVIQSRAGALVIGADAFFNIWSERLAALALRRGVPAIYQYREFALAGGLMSYGGDITDAYRLVGGYTGRILKGEKPADLPVQQSTKVELIINLKTAKALGLTVPPVLLTRADEVIE